MLKKIFKRITLEKQILKRKSNKHLVHMKKKKYQKKKKMMISIKI